MSASSETESTAESVDPTPSEAAAMIEALKRKLFQYATELQTTKDTLSSLEGTLEVEKREHQLTTTKLSSLLRKRSAQAPPTPQRVSTSPA